MSADRFAPPDVLENRFVRMEPLAETHRADLRTAGDDPDLWRFHSQNQYARTFDAWFDWSLDGSARGGELCFAVRDRATGGLAGSSSYLAITPAHRRLEIGSTWYAKPFQGGATNPSCKRLLMAYVFEALGWNRVEFKLDVRNARSAAAMRKLGAVEEGVHRAHMLLPDGHVRDTLWYSVVAAEWPAVRDRLDARLAVLG